MEREFNAETAKILLESKAGKNLTRFNSLEELFDDLDIAMAHVALAEIEEHGSVPWEKVKADLGLDTIDPRRVF